MTVSSSQNRVSFVGNGTTTSFSTNPVSFFEHADLDVILVTDADGTEDTLVLDTDYTVTGGAGAVGTVVTTVAPAVGETLVVVRRLDVVQEIDFVNNSISDADVMEESIDRLTMIAQQLATDAERSMRFPEGFTGDFDPTIPAGVLDAAGSSFIVNEDGDAFTVGPTADEITNAQTYAETAATEADAAAASAVAADSSADAAAVSAGEAAASATSAEYKTFLTAKGAIISASAASTPSTLLPGNAGTLKIADASQTAGWANWVPRSHISGLIVSNNASDATNDLDISVGEASDDSSAYMMRLTSAMTKRKDAAWAAGTAQGGMLNSESAPADGWLHVWLIHNPTTGDVDVGLTNHATSGVSPTLPSGYTVKRLLGSRRVASSTISPVYVAETAGGGELVQYVSPIVDHNLANTLSTSRSTLVVSTPLGYSTDAYIIHRVFDAVASPAVKVAALQELDSNPIMTASPGASYAAEISGVGVGMIFVTTNSAAQVAARCSVHTADQFQLITQGWNWARRI